MAGELPPDPKPVDTLADFPHEVAKDAPVALPDVLPGESPWVATRAVIADAMPPDNVIKITLEREASPGVWVMDAYAIGAPGQAQIDLATTLNKGGNYRWITHSKQPATGTLVDPPPPKPIPVPKPPVVEKAEAEAVEEKAA